MPLNRTDTSKTQRFEDGAAWLELRTRLTKHDEDVIADLNSHYRLPAGLFGGTATEADPAVEVRTNLTATNRTLFELLAVAWSISDERPTAADYDTLDQASGRWVDECVNEARKIGEKRAEGKSISRGRQSDLPASSPTEGASRSTRSQRKSNG